jgi:hypothetical protein
MYRTIFSTIPNHPDVAESLLVVARVLGAKNDETASATRRECLEMFERTLGPAHPRTIKAKSILGDQQR